MATRHADLGPFDLVALMAEGQHGVFTAAQARAAGLSRHQIAKLLDKGVYERVLPRVLGVAGAPRTWERSAVASQMWAGDRSALAHESAARAWGLSSFGAHSPVHVASVDRVTPPKGIRLHRYDDALLREISFMGPFQLTSPARTVMDLAGKRHPRAERALDQFLREGIAGLDQFWSYFESHWAKRRRGIRIMHGFLVERTVGMAASDSELEDMMWRIIRRYQLPRPSVQFPVRLPEALVHVDFAYAERLIAIECDGYAVHMDRRSFERDRVRDNQLQALGWVVLRYTWSQLRYSPGRVAEEIRFHVENKSTAFSGRP